MAGVIALLGCQLDSSGVAWAARKKPKPAAPRATVASVRIAVTVVDDASFSPLSPANVQASLRVASETFASKFGTPQLGFEPPKFVSTRAYFAGLPQDDYRTCLARHDGRRALRLQDYDRPRLQESVSAFLSRWRMPALVPAFPPALRPQLRNHDDAARALIAEMREAADKAFSASFVTHERLLAPTGDDVGRRFVDWLCAFEVQRETDVVMTNAYVFYDLLSEPYPHAVYHGSRLAGAVMQSPARELFLGRGVFVSTFGLGGEPAALLEPGHSRLTAAGRDAFIGTYLVAHELGHALLRIPDVYDHPPKCLMTTDYALGYVEGYERLLAHTGRCPRCAGYVAARQAFQEFEEALKAKRIADAERLVDKVVKKLPPHIDGSAADYAARVYTRLAQRELDAHRWKKTEHYCKRALAADPLHAPARVLLRRVYQQQNTLGHPPSSR